MSINHNLRWAGLPGGKWWVITLSGLVLLCLIMVFSEQGSIESDLEHRVMEYMAAEKIKWISVELEGRGRDVLLTGNAPSAELGDLAIEMVEGVYGVRVVEDQIDIKSLLSSSELSIRQLDGRVLLAGRLESQASIDTVVNAASETYGNDNVTNELIISGEVKTANWLAASTGLLPTLVGMKTAQLKISDSKSLLTAEVKSHGERLVLVQQARKLLGENLDAKIAVLASREPGMAKENAAKSGITATPVDPALKACQSKLDHEMEDKKILFASNTAELEVASHSLLNQIIIVLEEECNEVLSENGLTIAGHTDSVGNDRYNLALSQKRADAVKAYFVNADVDVGLISSVGYGESQPVESNDTEKGRTQNRRIEFKLEHK
jgi:OOP family OmpA-OmpF porin